MKKLYILLFSVVTSLSFGQTFYSENMGTPSGTTAIDVNVFQNSAPILYSGTADVRATSGSTGYNGASGSGNVFINAIDEFFQIDGLNSAAFNTADIQLSFGINTPTAVTNVLIVEVSTDATNWTPVSYTPSGTGWTLATISGGVIPSSATLSIRFKSSSTLQYRIDDVKLSSVSASCTLALGTATTACDASTLALDTYSITIPYTGGGNATYVITPTAGIVGGDNPSTTAAGNIIISGVPEGSTYAATIIGGTCNFSINGNSPDCKPILPLPLKESFEYGVGTSLASTQSWSNSNAGDTIDVVAGSLNYPNYPSLGNSVSFVGAGSDPNTKFTVTTAGTVYASFLINVTDVTTVTTDLSETVIAALTGDASSSFRARLFFKKNGTQYQLGCTSAIAATPAIYDATLFDVGNVVAVVIGYDFTANELKMWLNPNFSTFTNASPANITETPATAFTNLGGFILRQDTNALTPAISFDELRIAETTTALLSVSQNETIAGLEVYPNPVTNGILFVDTKANAEKNIAIYDLIGKQVLNTTTASSTINVAQLNGGVYILRITEAGKTATSKLVIK
jgi:hypothetical protein